MECELLRSPMISYQSLLYNTTVLYDDWPKVSCNNFRYIIYVLKISSFNHYSNKQTNTYVHMYILEAREISVADEVVLLVIVVVTLAAAVIAALDVSAESTLAVTNL